MTTDPVKAALVECVEALKMTMIRSCYCCRDEYGKLQYCRPCKAIAAAERVMGEKKPKPKPSYGCNGSCRDGGCNCMCGG